MSEWMAGEEGGERMGDEEKRDADADE